MKIYLTRHGETEWNREGRMQGWKNSNLTEKGISNARKLGEHLKDINFDYVFCSPLGRAVETAQNILGDKECEITYIDDLKEMGFGIFEGMMHIEIGGKYPEHQKNLWEQPHLYEPVDGEGYVELIDRVKRVLDHIISNATGENILIVTHACIVKAIYLIIKNYTLDKFWSDPFIYDTCLSIIEMKGGKLEFILEADTSHLE